VLKLRLNKGKNLPKDTGIDFPHYPHHKSPDLGVCRLAAAAPPDAGGLGQRKKGRRRKKGGRLGPVDSTLLRQAGWHNKAAAPAHVARQARAHA
jgi:hypothetical protein